MEKSANVEYLAHSCENSHISRVFVKPEINMESKKFCRRSQDLKIKKKNYFTSQSQSLEWFLSFWEQS